MPQVPSNLKSVLYAILWLVIATPSVRAQTDWDVAQPPVYKSSLYASNYAPIIRGQDDSTDLRDRPDVEQIEQPAALAAEPPAPFSSLLGQLDSFSAPSAVAVLTAFEPPAIETTALTRKSRAATNVSAVRRSPIAMQPIVRGYQQQSIYSRYDGANFVPVRFDLDSIVSNIDPGIIENLVIIPGPFAVRYGPGLAFIDIESHATPRYDNPHYHGQTNLLYNSNGEQFYGRETVLGGGTDYGFRASYGHKTGNDYQSGDNIDIPASYNVRDVDMMLSFDTSAFSTLDVQYLRQDLTDTEYAGLVFDADLRKTDAFFAKYSSQNWSGANRWTLEGWYNRSVLIGNNLGFGKQDFYQDSIVFQPLDSFAGFTDADVTNAGGRVESVWGDNEVGQLRLGADFRFVEEELNEFDDFDALAAPPFAFAAFPVPRSEQFDAGVYAELMQPVDDRLELNFGFRLDWNRTEQDAVYESTDPEGVVHVFDNIDPFSDTEILYHGFATANYKLNPCLDFRIGVGHGQRPPNATERFATDPYMTVVQSATSALLGDPLLTPERATQFDAAFIGAYDSARFRANAFVSYIENHITLASAIEVAPDPDQKLLDFVNQDSLLTGFELSGELDLSPSLTIFALANYVYAKNYDADEPLPSIFPLESRAGIHWHEPEFDWYGVELTARVVAGQYRVADSLLEFGTPGFAIYNVRGYVQATDSIRVTAGIDNLGDKNYLEHLSIDVPTVLEPGISFYVATQFEY
ncbi:MAG: iron complex outermembrane receptor protein [Pirellulaceae bacterium]